MKKKNGSTDNKKQKSAVNNQWTNANTEAAYTDHRERRDGPGGENTQKKPNK